LFFNKIIDDVLAKQAFINVYINNNHHLEFREKFVDSSGNSTNQDQGHTYKKLLCIAFDLAILRAYLNDEFPRFVYHDGVFEGLDERTSKNLLDVLRQYASMGIQQIITVIDSDVPKDFNSGKEWFFEEEIICLLHDEGPDGRLFQMSSW
jgi:uncharacterized protein YydD (DUF2326 family)